VGPLRRPVPLRLPDCRGIALPGAFPAISIIDDDLPAPKIGERDRPLATNTRERIRRGLERLSNEPFAIRLTHGGAPKPLTLPLVTLTQRHDMAMVLAAGERPAVGDPRVWLGPHNQLRDETAVVCWSCEQGWTAEIAAKPCPGPDGSPLGDLAGGLSGAPPLGNTRAGMTAVGRNDPCPCGSGQKFKRCHGA
jgi:hypothetical protein